MSLSAQARASLSGILACLDALTIEAVELGVADAAMIIARARAELGMLAGLPAGTPLHPGGGAR